MPAPTIMMPMANGQMVDVTGTAMMAPPPMIAAGVPRIPQAPAGFFGQHREAADQMRRAVEFTQRALKSGHCCALCSPFMSIPPLLRTERGTWINPTFDALRVFHLGADPFPVESLGAGKTAQVSLVVQAEENEMGDLLVSELLSSTIPRTARTTVMLKSQQNDRVLMNTPILDRFVFSTSQLRHNVPCCFLIQATNFVQATVKNISSVPVDLRIAARGQRFLPYQQPELREQILAYWNANRTTPYWLGLDLVQQGTGIVALDGGGVQIPAGATATAFMTVPGAGDFQAEDPMCLVEESTGLFTVDPGDIDVIITEGVGRQLMDQALPLGDFVAQPNRHETVPAGGSTAFQGAEFRASSGGHSTGPSQFFKRNTRMRVVLTNNSAFTANVWFCWRGCMHYYESCPPDNGMHRALSLEPLIGPMLTTPSRCPPYQTFAPVPGQGMQPVGGAPIAYPMPQGYQLPGVGAPAPYGYPQGVPLYPQLPRVGMPGAASGGAVAGMGGMGIWKVEAPAGGYGGTW